MNTKKKLLVLQTMPEISSKYDSNDAGEWTYYDVIEGLCETTGKVWLSILKEKPQ